MNYKEMNNISNGQKVICIRSHNKFKKGDIGTITFEYYGEGLYYKYVNLEDGRTDVLNTFYEYWELSSKVDDCLGIDCAWCMNVDCPKEKKGNANE